MKIKNSGFSFVKVTSLVFCCLFFLETHLPFVCRHSKYFHPQIHCVKSVQIRSIHPSTGKYGPEKNSAFGHFLRSDLFLVSWGKFQEHLGIYSDEKLNFNYHISHANWKSTDKWLFSCFKSILKVLHSNCF